MRTAAFTLPVPAKDKASVGTASFDDGDAAIVRVTRVEDGKPAAETRRPGADPMAARMPSMLGQLMGRQVYDALMSDMERRANIERKPLAAPTPEG